MILIFALLSCVRLEPALDNSTIEGTVEVLPTRIEETKDAANGTLNNAVVIEPLAFGATQIIGKTSGFGMNGDDFANTSDEDWFRINPPANFADQGCAPDPYVFEYLVTADTAGTPRTMGSTFSLDLEDPGATVRIDFLDLDVIVGSGPSEGPIVFQSIDVTGSGSVELCMLMGANYALHLGGVSGPGSVNWTLTMTGLHPDDSGLKVGAWQSADLNDRGSPIGGTNVHDFTGGSAAENWVWTGQYDIFLVRSVTTTNVGEKNEKTDVDEHVKEAWLFAGDWPSLNLPLPAGTWHSSKPVNVKLNKEAKSNHLAHNVVYKADKLIVDSIAPLVIGQEFAEAPAVNDLPGISYASYQSFDPAVLDENAQDLGILSNPGEVDLLFGTTTLTAPDDVGWEFHDTDLFKFQVPVSQLMYFNLDWADGAADLDAVVFDSTGMAIDLMITYDKPEVTGGLATYEPGLDYYIVLLPWFDPEDADMEWQLNFEGVSP